MASKQEMKKKALKLRNNHTSNRNKEVKKHNFNQLKNQREINDSIGVLSYDHKPRSVKELNDLAHFQWIQAYQWMKKTNSKRLSLEPYNGSWVRMAGVVSEAVIRNGIMRICVAAPELILEQNGQVITSGPIDSHIWLKMSKFIINRHEDQLVDHRPINEVRKGSLSDGVLSLGDYFTFDAYIEPYIHGKVKYGISKFKNISIGGLLWNDTKHRENGCQYIRKYPRSGWLIKAKPIDGTSNFSYQFANWDMIQKQVNFFKEYQSNYGVEQRLYKKGKE